MEIPTIQPQDIARFHELHDEFKRISEQASAAIVVAQDNKENEITIARNGKPVVVSENALWQEVWALGPESEAGGILKEMYPQAFELSAKAEAKKNEMKAFSVTKWGIDPLAMSLSDIIRIIQAVVKAEKV